MIRWVQKCGPILFLSLLSVLLLCKMLIMETRIDKLSQNMERLPPPKLVNGVPVLNEALQFGSGSGSRGPRGWNVGEHVKQGFNYSKDSPILWIGGMPRSGTTLMRVVLDAHEEVRCAPESRVIPRILTLRGSWNQPEEAAKLQAAGLDNSILDRAITSFILSVLVEHGEPTRVLCNKDPYTLENATYLSNLFPNSKFILMIRDGRAVVRSIIGQKMNIIGCVGGDHKQCLSSWNRTTSMMMAQCEQLGPNRCMRVLYELMVLDFESWVTKILNFLQLPFEPALLRFHERVGVPGGILVSAKERSTKQVNRPIYLDGLTDWISDFPRELYSKSAQYAPLLVRLGYDVDNYPPDYSSLKQKAT